MGTVKWVAGLVLALGLAAPAFAQSTNNFGGVNAALLKFEPIDVSQSVAPVPIARPQVVSRRFSLTNILPKFSFAAMSNKPVIGFSQFPSQDGLPGKNYLKSFGFGRLQPIE